MIGEGNDSDTLGDGPPQYLVGARNNASIIAPDLIPPIILKTDLHLRLTISPTRPEHTFWDRPKLRTDFGVICVLSASVRDLSGRTLISSSVA
jgi:hypothetical protein